jgi:hypothetical protein
MEIADMINQIIAARLGPNSTFAEREVAAAAIEVEVLAELARRQAAARSGIASALDQGRFAQLLPPDDPAPVNDRSRRAINPAA